MKRRLVQIENAIRDIATVCEIRPNTLASCPDGGQPSQYRQMLLNSPSPSQSLARETGLPGTS